MGRNIKQRTKRNNKLVDGWSYIHFLSAAALCFLFGPLAAIVITFAWEPIELFVLSPILAKFDVLFGHETLRNSLSDLVMDSIGVLAAYSVTQLI